MVQANSKDINQTDVTWHCLVRWRNFVGLLLSMNTIALYEKGKIIKNYKRVSEVLNKYFTNLTKSLKLKKCISRKSFLNTSIKKINQSYPKKETFSFREIRATETLEIIKSLPKKRLLCLKISKWELSKT